jgi:hypothetical protein
MKTLIREYQFDSENRLVVFASLPAIQLERVLLVTNVTAGKVMYNFADDTKGGVVLDNILVLDYDTSEMNDDDDLQVYYDMGNYNTLLDDTTTPNITYVGKAAIGSDVSDEVWQIKRIDETSGLVITWADGDDMFDNTWSARATTIVYS